MNIFDQTFDEKVTEQLKKREAILKGNPNGRSPEYIQYITNKNSFIRFTSGVDVIDSKLQEYFNINNQDELALKNILEGGTLTSQIINNNIVGSSQKKTFNEIYSSTDDFGKRPMPGITGMSIKSYGDRISTLRIATVSITCFDIKQLEILEILYMRPGYRVLLEWGHSIHFTSTDSNINQTIQRLDIIKKYSEKSKIQEAIKKGQETTEYNYDAMIGKVRNYSWESNTNGTYTCTIEVIALGDVIDSLKINIPFISKNEPETDANSTYSINSTSALFSILDKIIAETDTSLDDNIAGSLNYNKLYETLNIKKSRNTDEILKIFFIIESVEKKLVYIRLQDFIKILNDTCIILEGDKPYSKIDEILGKCISHPYQISGDPYCCLVSSYNRISTTIKYGGDLNKILTENFPYRNENSEDINITSFEGDINEILIEINHVKELMGSLIKEEKNKYEIFLKDLIQTLLNNISSAIGNINDFQFIISPDNEFESTIIDINYIQAKTKNDYYTIPLVGIGEENKGGTYVRNYRLNTQITNEISTIVSIGASVDQTKNNNSGYKTSVYNVFNQGIKDRLTKKISNSINDEPLSEDNNEENYFFNLIKNTKELLKLITHKKVGLSSEQASALKINIKDLITYSNNYSTANNFSFGCYTPVPLKLSITMDGISGLKVGQIFKIPSSRLLHQYKISQEMLKFYEGSKIGEPRVAFIIFGIDHNISINEGWTTTLDCQMVMLNPDIITQVQNVFDTVEVIAPENTKEWRYIEEQNDKKSIHLVLVDDANSIEIRYGMIASDNFNNQNKKYYKDQFSEALSTSWDGFKLKFIDDYLIAGKYSNSSNVEGNVIIYFPYGLIQNTQQNNIEKFRINEIIDENAKLYRYYSDKQNPNKWYGSGDILLEATPPTPGPKPINLDYLPKNNGIEFKQ